MKKIKEFTDKLKDPLEFVRLKLVFVGILLIAGMMLDGR